MKTIIGGFIGLSMAVVIVSLCDFDIQGDGAYILGSVIGGASATLGMLIGLTFE